MKAYHFKFLDKTNFNLKKYFFLIAKLKLFKFLVFFISVCFQSNGFFSRPGKNKAHNFFKKSHFDSSFVYPILKIKIVNFVPTFSPAIYIVFEKLYIGSVQPCL